MTNLTILFIAHDNTEIRKRPAGLTVDVESLLRKVNLMMQSLTLQRLKTKTLSINISTDELTVAGCVNCCINDKSNVQ